MGLDAPETSSSVVRASILMLQLPSGSRLFRIDNPNSEWPVEAHFLRLVEYELRSLIYGMGGRKGKKPKPVELPSDSVRKQDAIDAADEAMDEVNQVLAAVLQNESEVISDG